MGNVDDVRKVFQDLVAPDLKALSVRIEALEKEMKLRFDHVDKRFSSMEKEMKLQFDHVNTRFEDSDKLILERFSSLERLASARHDTVMATMTSITSALEMEKRLARLESERNKPEAQHA